LSLIFKKGTRVKFKEGNRMQYGVMVCDSFSTIYTQFITVWVNGQFETLDLQNLEYTSPIEDLLFFTGAEQADWEEELKYPLDVGG